jgi:hypothetical protein
LQIRDLNVLDGDQGKRKGFELEHDRLANTEDLEINTTAQLQGDQQGCQMVYFLNQIWVNLWKILEL